jgi:hypothetical protein
VRHGRFSTLARQGMEAVALALGGRAGARLADRLGSYVRRMTLLRLVRALPEPPMLTQDTFDALEPDKAGRYLRELLVGAGLLPPRDELLARLERWLHATIDAIPSPAQRHLLQQYTVWHLLRRLRRRVTGARANTNQCGA